MPYVKRSRRPRRFRRRSSNKTIARIAKKVFNKQVETKYNNFQINAVPLSNVPFGQAMNNLAQGTTTSTRVGNSVRIQGLKLRYELQLADTFNVCRVYVLWSRAPINGSLLPGPLEVLSKDRQNFKVLYDRTHVLDQDDPTFVTTKDISRYIGGFSRFNNATATPTAGYLSLYAVSDSTLVSHPTFSFAASVTYQDA